MKRRKGERGGGTLKYHSKVKCCYLSTLQNRCFPIPRNVINACSYDNTDECKVRHHSKYSWCNSDNDARWGFCSEKTNIASNGKPCKSVSPCGRVHDGKTHSYNWCYTLAGNWDYCGEIEYATNKTQ